MFGLWKKVNRLDAELALSASMASASNEITSKRLANIEQSLPGELVTCALCGCAVIKRYAFVGEGVVRERRESYFKPKEEYIHHDYFCKACNESKTMEEACDDDFDDDKCSCDECQCYNEEPPALKSYIVSTSMGPEGIAGVRSCTVDQGEVIFFSDDGEILAAFPAGKWCGMTMVKPL